MESWTATEILALICDKAENVMNITSSYDDRSDALQIFGQACSERMRRQLLDDWNPVLLPGLMPFNFDDSVVTICGDLAEYMRVYLHEIGLIVSQKIINQINGVILSISGGCRSVWTATQQSQLRQSVRLILIPEEDRAQLAPIIATRMLLNQIDTIFCLPVSMQFVDASSR